MPARTADLRATRCAMRRGDRERRAASATGRGPARTRRGSTARRAEVRKTQSGEGARSLELVRGGIQSHGARILARLALIVALLAPLASARTTPLYPGPMYPTGAFPWQVVVADLNGDAKSDLVVGTAGSRSVSVLLGVGDGTFGSATGFLVGSTPESVAVGDLNGDGKPISRPRPRARTTSRSSSATAAATSRRRASASPPAAPTRRPSRSAT